MNKRSELGISIVEIMVALTIGLFLTAGIVQLFYSSKQTYRAQEGFSRLQENGRYALDLMARNLRGHGNLGCISMAGMESVESLEVEGEGAGATTYWGRFNVLAADLRDADDLVPGLDFLAGYAAPMGYQEDATDDDLRTLVLPADGSVTWVDNTDALVLVGVFGKGTYLGADMTEWDDDLVLANNEQDFKIGDLLLITDCANVDIFQVSNVGGTTIMHGRSVEGNAGSGNLSDQLSTLYRADSPSSINAMVFPFSFTSYFVGTPDEGATRSLYVRSLGQAPRELVRNVDDMVLSFFVGADLDPGPEDPKDGYVRASEVADWKKVQNVQIQLLVRSPEPTMSQSRALVFDGSNYDDRFQREVFATTVALRPRSQWRMR